MKPADMKKWISVIVFFVYSISLYAQEKTLNINSMNTVEQELSLKDSVIIRYLDAFISQLREPCYKLFPTTNRWIFLKLNTATGQIWQVQYSIDGYEHRFQTVLDDNIRLAYNDELICGRFTLYETQNMYNFILIDQIDGRCWQVQWSIDYDTRMVLRIY